MYEEIDDAMIKHTIGGYEELSKKIHEELQRTCKELCNRQEEVYQSELIESASIPGREDEAIGHSNLPRDLYDTYERYKHLEREQITEAAQYIVELTSKQETMNRIMTCVRILPQNEKNVILTLYGPGQNFNKGRVELINEVGIPETTVKRFRIRAMKHIKELYGLDYSQMQLYQYDITTHSLRSYR